MIGNKETGEAITGSTTGEDGKFSITTSAKDFFVEVTFIGYESQARRDISIKDGKVDLGTIQLAEDSRALKEVVVRGEKSRTEFKLDKRVFNVGQDLASTGASALEVLNNVLSVNVTIEGQITLRGSAGVQILIDGKPSVMADQQSNALGTITADMIESVEVITNPSAKYDAEGTSGILNIILKKEEKKGLNGSVTLNTGIPDNHSLGVSLNRRTEKFNLFTQLGVGYRSLPQYSESINRDKTRNTTVRSNGTEYRNETFYNVILGTDYHINALNVVTLSGNFAYEVEKQPSRYDFSFSDSTGAIVSKWQRQETTAATNPKYQYELQYEKKFEDNEDHVLLFSAIGSFFGKNQSSEFINTPVLGDNFNNDQQTDTKFKQADYTFKLDYTDLNTLLTTTNEANNRNFTNLFPTLHSSYKLERYSIGAGGLLKTNLSAPALGFEPVLQHQEQLQHPRRQPGLAARVYGFLRDYQYFQSQKGIHQCQHLPT